MKDLQFGDIDFGDFDVISVGFSGGKDSTALCAALTAAGIEFEALYADTGWERTDENGENVVLRYAESVAEKLGFPLHVVGYPGGMEARIREKGAMPKLGKTKWCTRELKVKPMMEYMVNRWGDEHTKRLDHVLRLTDIRWDESRVRSERPRTEEDQWGMTMCHPILHWTVEDVLQAHHDMGLEVNPLYQEPFGMNRVGCWPCVMERKDGIRRIADADPERIAKIRELEAFVEDIQVNERGHARGATFYSLKRKQDDGEWRFEFVPIDEVVKWSNTKRGGAPLEEPPLSGCSLWGLCEPPDDTLKPEVLAAKRPLPVVDLPAPMDMVEEPEEDCSVETETSETETSESAAPGFVSAGAAAREFAPDYFKPVESAEPDILPVKAFEMDVFEFMERLPDGSVDGFITDLPYPTKERHRRVGTKTRLSISKSSANLWFETLTIDQLCEFLELAYAKLKRNSYLWAYCDDDTDRILSSRLGVGKALEALVPTSSTKAPKDSIGFNWWSPHTWLKTTLDGRLLTEDDLTKEAKKLEGYEALKLAPGMGWHGAGCTERILLLEKGKLTFKQRINNAHPAPRPRKPKKARMKATSAKPVELAETFLLATTDPGDTVVDPFIGFGTHALAIQRMGRKGVVNDHDLVGFRDWAPHLGIEVEYVDPQAHELIPPPPKKRRKRKAKPSTKPPEGVQQEPAQAAAGSGPELEKTNDSAKEEGNERVEQLPPAPSEEPLQTEAQRRIEAFHSQVAQGVSQLRQGARRGLVVLPEPKTEPPEVKVTEPLPEEVEHVIFASYGNDSIALIQWAYEEKLKGVVVAHSDTGWAAEAWKDRIARCEEWVRGLGFYPHRVLSIGMMDLIRSKKGWPLPRKYQFCTTQLKIVPAEKFLDLIDPDKDVCCLVGVRREESAARMNWHTEESDKHGGRELWSPLVRHTKEMRDELVERAGFEVLPYRSQECFPCINANRKDLQQLTEHRVDEIESLEISLGNTSKGKPRTMFRPYRHMGATGIREVKRWADSPRGKFEAQPFVILGEGTGCDSGMCGEG